MLPCILSQARLTLPLLALACFSLQEPAQGQVDFATEVRAILADACFQCHGPDEESREAELRLDVQHGVMAVVESGNPGESELLSRIRSGDPDLVMPPPDSGKSLTTEQISLLEEWIQQGAEFQGHWAFEVPRRPADPQDGGSVWQQSEVDYFIHRKLQTENLEPAPRAETTTLVRRLSLDLTGLPPEPDFAREWAEKLNAVDAAAQKQLYEDLVEELMRSPHFGERWARLWLDAARYADSDGYEKDKPRTVWFYRDWVINAFNQDMPYDEFIVKQIAGDLLPNATQEDIVATGFLRNSMVNEEGGADPEQFRMEAMFDRVDAVGKAMLGLTIQCAQCHTHKYDPLQHEDYYRMFACLNNTHDRIATVYTVEEQERRDQILQDIERCKAEIQSEIPDWKARLQLWAADLAKVPEPKWITPELQFSDTSLSGSKFLRQADGSYLCQSYAPTTFKPEMTGRFDGSQLTGLQLELLLHPNLPRNGPGRSVDGTWALSEIRVKAVVSGKPDEEIELKLSRAAADRSPAEAPLKPRYDNKKKDVRLTGGVEFAIDGDEKTAWTNEVDSPLSNSSNRAWFEFEDPLRIPEGEYATLTVSLAQRHGGWNSDDNQTFNIGCYRLSFTADEIPNVTPPSPAVATVVSKPPEEWSEEEWDIAFDCWRETIEPVGPWNEKINAAWQAHPLGITQLCLSERSAARETWLLGRGDFLSKQRLVEPGVPDFLHAWPNSDEPARLQFARWLASEESPTTARSIVNRIWQAYFGFGLVETSDDLGTQSARPSHPELLDFLARELMDNGWSLKHVHRLIVSSATYQQSSKVTKAALERDPYNRLLARGARFRVPAETVRDISLAASGLLSKEVGGRSVFPPAPSFLFTPPVSYGPKTWNEESGSERHRRALYTFRFRSVPYPMLENFDATACNVSCVKRSISNTPMQALTAMNEPLFLECAVALAKKAILESSSPDDDQRIRFIIWRCLTRDASRPEIDALSGYLDQQRKRFESGELDPKEILSAAGMLDLGFIDELELANWSLLSRVVLNLDETITRQ